jgi:hypothetical protein
MREQTVELPKLRRARGGWVMYGAYEDSVCQYHQFCTYSGDELGRCARCHSNTHPTNEHGDLPPDRTAPCLCSRCGELFKSRTGFDIHQTQYGRCRNPARRGLVLVKQSDRYGDIWQLWAKPGSRPDDI